VLKQSIKQLQAPVSNKLRKVVDEFLVHWCSKKKGARTAPFNLFRQHYFTTLAKSLPALNLTTFLAGIFISLPV
jgi:hypothetical protein